MKFVYTFLKITFVFLFLLGLASCGGGGGSGSDTTDIEIGGSGDGQIIVDPIFVRTGVSSSTVIDQEYRTTVYVGRYLYQKDESNYDLSFNPSKNFLKDLEFNGKL